MNGQASVSFSAPVSTGGSPIINYTATSSPGSFTGTAASSPIIVTGLTNGTAYTFTVHATNVVGNSAESAASNSVTPAAGTPGIPTMLPAVAGDTTVTVNWQAPFSNGGSPITGYTVQSVGDGGAYNWTGLATTIVMTGLTNGNPYSFTVYATNAAGNSAVSAASGAVMPVNVLPVIYGPGLAMDSAQNYPVGGANAGVVSHRFRASTSSAADSAIAEFRIYIAGGYSGGTGGTIRVGIKADSGGLPTGSYLCSADWTVGSLYNTNDHYIRQLDFGSPYTVTAGTLYHLVFTNVDGAPATNFCSINDAYVFPPALTPRQPAYSDADYAVLYQRSDMYGGAWHEETGSAAVMDVVYANGSHDGMGYVGPHRTSVSLISGTTMMARERFTVTGGDKVITGVHVRPGRTSGSDPLLLRLETAAGVEIETVAIPAASVGIVPTPGADYAVTGYWAGAAFASAHTLTNGQTYNLRLSCAATSQYSMSPILHRDFTDDGTHYLQSRWFSDGRGQKTIDSGSTWTQVYPYQPVNMQFYFTF
jgi:Fibronectin type III domain